MEGTGGIDPKCTLHVPLDFSPVKTIAVAVAVAAAAASLSSSPNDLIKHQNAEFRANDTNSDALRSADSKEAVEASDIAQREQMLQLADSCELEFGDTVEARKSLAWDSAFFDSAGILDEEELSNMIHGGACISRKKSMPLHRSNSTISTLERIEAELFTDIKASTQKFVKEPDLVNLSGKAAVEDRGTKVSNSSKMTDTTSRNMPSPILKKESVSSEAPQQIKRQSSRHVPAVQAVTSTIHKAPIATRRTNPISPQSRSVTNANLSKLEPRKSKDTVKPDSSSIKALMGGVVSTKPVSISRSVSLSSSSPLIKKTSASVDLGRKVGSTAVHQKRLPSSNTTTKGQTDLKSYLMLSNKRPSRKSSASSVSDTSSESYLSTPALNNNHRRSHVSSTSCKSIVQSKVGRTLKFMSKSNDRLLGSVRSLSKAMTNQDSKKGGPNGAKPVNLSSSSSPQIVKGRVGTAANPRWM